MVEAINKTASKIAGKKKTHTNKIDTFKYGNYVIEKELTKILSSCLKREIFHNNGKKQI